MNNLPSISEALRHLEDAESPAKKAAKEPASRPIRGKLTPPSPPPAAQKQPAVAPGSWQAGGVPGRPDLGVVCYHGADALKEELARIGKKPEDIGWDGTLYNPAQVAPQDTDAGSYRTAIPKLCYLTEEVAATADEIWRLKGEQYARELAEQLLSKATTAGEPEQSSGLGAFLEAVAPIVNGLYAEGQKSMATMSPGTVAHLAHRLHRLLLELEGREALSPPPGTRPRRKQPRYVPGRIDGGAGDTLAGTLPVAADADDAAAGGART